MAGAALIVGGTAGVSNAAVTPPPGATAFTGAGNYGVVTSEHPDTTGCNGYKVVGSGTVTGNRITGGGTWTQKEDACTATVPGKWDINGTVTIKEADGDQLFFTYHLSAPLTADTMVYPTGTFTITGGTGSFDEAVGGGKMNATVNLLDKDHVSAVLDGSMGFRWQI
ncbi:hypothetical protein GCM10010222_47220 [Streptomyces tanashiensis]|uniref:hypothetical protein n=1 Tax=Streptomyces tanashiensis TaxID=67367 RepID=UPI0016774690|nr:hypothetical protein [Streptomyces tanashiensis]GGT00088.1 hypothetical protein GCM10010222_47220 [Streptomyces tanashiensis]